MRSARGPILVVVGLVGSILGAAPAPGADSGPVIVIPGRPGVPIIINGVDVTGAVIEGDFGLYSPHMVNPVVIPAPLFAPPLFFPGGYDPRRYGDGYFPALGRTPGYGRREIEPPADRRLPPPAQSFRRSWSSQSEPAPASVEPPPPLLVAPQIYPGGGRKR
jgi:hypothetical protein